MSKRKRTLAAAEESVKNGIGVRSSSVNGKQERVKPEATVDGIPIDEFIRENADPIFLLQNEMYEELYKWKQEQQLQEPRLQMGSVPDG
jgi:hypothetical protein